MFQLSKRRGEKVESPHRRHWFDFLLNNISSKGNVCNYFHLKQNTKKEIVHLN